MRTKEDENELLKRTIKCKLCDDEIVSHHRHDFKYCSCGAIFIDGGTDYMRMGGKMEEILLWKDGEWKAFD